jgi:hypothetical protein
MYTEAVRHVRVLGDRTDRQTSLLTRHIIEVFPDLRRVDIGPRRDKPWGIIDIISRTPIMHMEVTERLELDSDVPSDEAETIRSWLSNEWQIDYKIALNLRREFA